MFVLSLQQQLLLCRPSRIEAAVAAAAAACGGPGNRLCELPRQGV